MPIDPKKNKPMMRVHKGDLNDLARQDESYTKIRPEEQERYEDGYDQIRWRSKRGLPPKTKINSITEAEAKRKFSTFGTD
jgi:hypothetical protein